MKITKVGQDYNRPIESFEKLADKEADRVGKSILIDAARNGQSGQVRVWPCGSVMCLINCRQMQRPAEVVVSASAG